MGKKLARFLIAALLLMVVVGCEQASEEGINPSMSSSTQALNPPAAICSPTNQDQYVFRPARLQFLQSCLRATGTVMQIIKEADGDVHLDLQVDAPSQSLLTPGNQHNEGYLVVEAICQYAPVQADAIRICAANTDPFPGPLPAIGDHVWAEGRYVLDLQHYSWAELHPLYRWGRVTP